MKHMLQLNFSSISEPKPGKKWKKLFDTHWPAYRAWFESKGAINSPDLKTAKVQFEKYMPELVPLYQHLCQLAGDDEAAARFLTGYQPPAYITGCSQAVWKKGPLLVRNYDYHPHLSEGTLIHSAWHGKQVIATGDCLWGAVDGMNSDGLAVSLTFGGRKVVGKGFGIPFILRYILEFCSDVEQAVGKLLRVPTHMAYNIMLLDKTGAHNLLQMAPDHKPIVTDLQASTNHQNKIDWPEHARFSKTLERERFLYQTLASSGQTARGLAETFLHSPLFNRQYNDGFGTIYTAVYRPDEGYMEMLWQDAELRQSFADFKEGNTLITYTDKAPVTPPAYTREAYKEVTYAHSAEAGYWEEYGKGWASGKHSELAQHVTKAIGDALGMSGTDFMEKILEEMASETKRRGQIPWELLADIWAKIGSYRQRSE